jgi:hypothetical protein
MRAQRVSDLGPATHVMLSKPLITIDNITGEWWRTRKLQDCMLVWNSFQAVGMHGSPITRAAMAFNNTEFEKNFNERSSRHGHVGR